MKKNIQSAKKFLVKAFSESRLITVDEISVTLSKYLFSNIYFFCYLLRFCTHLFHIILSGHFE